MKKRGILFMLMIFTLSFIMSSCKVEITATYDTVILGSGISSLTTALTLSEQGKRVLIVEESGILGGNKRMLANGVSYLNTEAGDTTETFIEDIKKNNDGTNFFTEKMVEASVDIPAWLAKYNIQLDKTIQLPGHSIPRTLVSTKGVHTGKEVITKLETVLKNSKVELNYNSKITKITSDKSNIYQLNIEQSNTNITVNAKTVVLGEDDKVIYDAAVPITNKTQMDSNNFASRISMTTGMDLLQSLGADYSHEGELNIIDTYNLSSAQQISSVLRSYGAILVNAEGKRFVNEMNNTPDLIQAILQQENQNVYLLYDNVIDDNLSFLNEYYKENTLLKSNSVTTLANSLNMDQDVLRTTIATYRQSVVNGEDTEFQRELDVNEKIFSGLGTDSGKLFAIKINPVVTAYSGYAEITDKFEVMKKGVALPGVFATGDSVADIKLNTILDGTELTGGIVMGDLTAESILAYLTENNL